MATNPIPSGSCNFPVNMPIEMRAALGQLAHQSNMSIGEYVRRLIEPAIRNGMILSKSVARVGVVSLALLGFGALAGHSIAAQDALIRSRTTVRVVSRREEGGLL